MEQIPTSKKVVTNNRYNRDGPAISRKLDSGEGKGSGSRTTPVLIKRKNRLKRN